MAEDRGAPIVFISRHRVKEGVLGAFLAHFEAARERLRADKPDTAVFLAFLDDDAGAVSFVHAFADAEAFDRHLEGAADRAQEAYEFLEPVGFEIYGAPSAGVLESMRRMAGSGVVVTVRPRFVGGFLRLGES